MTTVDQEAMEGIPLEDLDRTFGDLFNRYYRPVYRLFLRRGFAAEESKDLAQDTFIHAYRGLPRLRDAAGMGNWIFRIAHNVLKNEVRHRSTGKRAGVSIPLDPSALAHGAEIETDEEGVETRLLTEERTQLFHDALQELPPQMRLILQLRMAQDLKYREIADLLELKIGTVKAQLSLAKKRLKGSLAEQFHDIDS